MKTRHFLNTVEHDRIHRAIQAAERETTGRIILFISHKNVGDALAEAHKIFVQHKLETAQEKAGLLIFLAPKSQTFAVVGGTALHEKLGQSWWDHLAGLIGARFKEGRYTDGLLEAIEEAGRALKAHFSGKRPAHPERPDILEK